jgi:hypothetical protein
MESYLKPTNQTYLTAVYRVALASSTDIAGNVTEEKRDSWPILSYHQIFVCTG